MQWKLSSFKICFSLRDFTDLLAKAQRIWNHFQTNDIILWYTDVSPKVNLIGEWTINQSEDDSDENKVHHRFYTSDFPSCQGLPPEEEWEYVMNEQFKLNATLYDEYILYIDEEEVSKEPGWWRVVTGGDGWWKVLIDADRF